ncbi:MAG: hypothetical protein IPK83_04480 [Planctomycetes bacterium]|nr:hypothetical protein [Planctomycetota bacterium]
MSKNSRRIVGIVALVVINACALGFIYWKSGAGRANHVRVMTTFPKTEIDGTDRLGVVFDLPVARPEMVGKPAALNIAAIEPSHPGEWIWASADRLEYQLAEPLHAGMTYRIHLTDGFDRETGLMPVGETSFAFATRAGG